MLTDLKKTTLNLQLFAQEKTEEPTPHRLQEARRRGQVAKSVEIDTALNIFGMVIFFLGFGWYYREGLSALFYAYLGKAPAQVTDNFDYDFWLSHSLEQFILLAAPFFLAAFAVGLLSNVAQVGFLVSVEALKPQLNRLNPQEGLKRIFSRRSLFELVKSLLKVVLVGAVSFHYLYTQLPSFFLLLGQEVEVVFAALARMLVVLTLRVAAVYLLLAACDYLFQRSEHKKNLRMTRKELKDEYKQMEGDPHIRSRQRERQKELARRRSLQQVPQATLVVTNPTELAVALRYREKVDSSPVVVAKGS
ncbi:MAG TPA: flagellar biosynthesis protein FlhB, partial [Firmicutes bacterium]|nr:flagellar biosynthesis protein FlhB [Bacillota bacterium]